jgi:hypothetical protein
MSILSKIKTYKEKRMSQNDPTFATPEEAVAAHDEQEVITPVVPGQVVAPEDTVRPLEEVPADDYPEGGALPHNTNDAHDLIVASNDEANNPTVQGKAKRDKSVDRKKGETQAEYNERVAPGDQPVQPAPVYSYLGNKL